jgi:hypothetical protein
LGLRDRDGVIHAAAKTQDQWEKGVIYTFECLYQDPPCETSKAVIDALKATSKTVVIVPFTLKSYETAIRNLPAKLNAGAKADNAPDATVRGKLSDELDDSVLRQIAVTPDGPEREKLIARSLGTAAGSNSHLYFTFKTGLYRRRVQWVLMPPMRRYCTSWFIRFAKPKVKKTPIGS